MATKETTSNTVDPSATTKQMNDANTSQASQGLTLQAYCNSVAQQPLVDFGEEQSLKTYQTKINDGLTTAQEHATNYLNVLQPLIITNMSNIENYYAINSAVPATLPSGSTTEEWIAALNTLATQGTSYQQAASDTAQQLDVFAKQLDIDVTSFSTTVSDLNNAVLGDNGVLDSINGQLKTLQSQIDGEIAGVTLSALAIAGGTFMICVGGITDFVTAGTTTPLVVGGIGMLAGGVAGEIGTAITLANLNNAKASLLSEEADLKAEVKLATGVQSGYSSLLTQAQGAVTAALTMENAWKTLTSDLGIMVNDLENGIMTTGQIQELFLTNANTEVQTITADINTIKLQMSGVSSDVAASGDTVSDLILSTANVNENAKTATLTASPSPMWLTLAATTSSSTSSVATGINTANKTQSSQALTIQNYANSVTEQPNVDFSGLPTLGKYEASINSGLKTAQTHANTYLNVIQPSIITNIANISNYYALHNAVATTLPAGSTQAEWIQALTALEDQSKTYQIAANGVVAQLISLHSDLTTDSADFTTVVTELNAAVNGDNGVLDSVNSQLSTIQGQIDGAIAGTVLSGIAIAGGVFMIAVGAVTDFVTAGASTPLVLGGIAVVAAGVGGEVAAAVTLENLNNEKAKLLTEEANLTAEVKLATSISGGYQSLSGQVGNAVKAASGMQNAWEALSADLGSMINDLNQGIKSTGEIQTIFLTAANTTIQTVLTDTQTIKAQMAGVDNIVAKPGQTVGEAIVDAAQGSQSVSTQTTMLLKSSQFNATSGGVLTQSVGNLNQSTEQIKTIVNIPQAAQVIKTQSLTNISQLISQIQSLQGPVANFVTQATGQLNDIESQLKSSKSLDDVKKAVDVVSGEASKLKNSITRVAGAIQATITTTEGYFNKLVAVQNDLTQQRTSLQGRLGNARSHESAAKKKYYYLIALGPFGLAGLAAALALYLSLKKQVDEYESQVGSLNSQIGAINAIKAATDQLSSNFVTVISSVSGVKNSVSFLSNDVLAIKSDLGSGEARIVIEIALMAALTEVKTLGIDAS